jgi:hypothetical protein
MNGAVAYAAVLALQDPTFVASVREVAANPTQRQEMINNIFSNPSYAAVFKGSDSAAGLIIDTLGNDGLKVYAAGKAVKQAAYDVQKSSGRRLGQSIATAAWPPPRACRPARPWPRAPTWPRCSRPRPAASRWA